MGYYVMIKKTNLKTKRRFITFLILILLVIFLGIKAYFPQLISKNNLTKSNNEAGNSNSSSSNISNSASNSSDTSSSNDYSITILDVSSKMLSADFWTSKLSNSSEIIMNQEQISNFNSKIISNVKAMYDLSSYKDTISKTDIVNYINSYKLPTKTMYFSNGTKVDNAFYNSISDNLNMSNLSDSTKIKYGICIQKTSIRSFPTNEGIYSSTTSKECDFFQESACQACEGVLLLNQSKDSKWYFVQSNNYRGWVDASNIAVTTDKKQFFDYLNSQNFLVVTGNYIKTQFNPYSEQVSDEKFFMGTKIPFITSNIPSVIDNQCTDGNYVVKLPVRDKNGILNFKLAIISKNQDIHVGFLTYTHENILKQAFKLLGDRYDWGDKYVGRDCSGFILCIFKTFGFNLPRNTDVQELTPGSKKQFNKNDSLSNRNQTLDKVNPGAIIFMNNHVMLYLGKENGTHYIIHDFSTYYKKVNGSYSKIAVNEVAVTPVTINLSSSSTFSQQFTSVIEIK